MSEQIGIVEGSGRRPSGDYAALQNVLDEAYRQSAEGKGNARHANDKPFTDQPILSIGRMVGPGFAAGQVMKKAQEAIGMAARGETEAAANELLGAIVYAASAVVLVREKGVSLALAANAHLMTGPAPREFKVGDLVNEVSCLEDGDPGRIHRLLSGGTALVDFPAAGRLWLETDTLIHVD